MYVKILLKAQGGGKVGFFNIPDFRGGSPDVIGWGDRVFKRSTQDPNTYQEGFTYVIPANTLPQDE